MACQPEKVHAVRLSNEWMALDQRKRGLLNGWSDSCGRNAAVVPQLTRP